MRLLDRLWKIIDGEASFHAYPPMFPFYEEATVPESFHTDLKELPMKSADKLALTTILEDLYAQNAATAKALAEHVTNVALSAADVQALIDASIAKEAEGDTPFEAAAVTGYVAPAASGSVGS